MTLSRICASLALSSAAIVALGCGAPPPPAAPPARVAREDAGPSVSAPARTGEEAAAVPIAADDPTWGSRQALVTVVEFSDFECPFCGRVQPTLEKLRATYGPAKLRVVWKNEPLPFHPSARPAAEAAAGVFALAGRDAFWSFHDAAFKSQRALGPDSYERWAREAGLTDTSALRAGLAAHTWAGKIDRDQASARALGVDGTPAFYINGVALGGAQPLGRFVTVIDAELAKAEARVAAGTPRDDVYAAMTAENVRSASATNDEDDEPADTNVYRVPVGSAPVRGPKDAPVTLVEFSDFQCPFCKGGEETLARIRTTYGDKVRVVWKNEPLSFHPRALPAAELALEARAQKGDGAFWDAHDRLFEAQPNLEDADLDAVARAMGLDLAKTRAAIAKGKHQAAIDLDLDEAEDFRAAGTPHYFVNGRRVVGAQPFEVFRAVVDEELVKAKALAAKGVTAAAMYDALTEGGKGPDEPEMRQVTAAANPPTRGSAAAKVVVQEFADFQCPYCAKTNAAVDELLKAYDGKVKVVWRNVPLSEMHPQAELAAEAAMEAYAQKGNAGFWKMHEILFANADPRNGPDGLKRDALDGYARKLGLDMPRWTKALDGGLHKDAIAADVKAAEGAEIKGTPTFVINGYVLRGAQRYGRFRKLVERALHPPPARADAKPASSPAAPKVPAK